MKYKTLLAFALVAALGFTTCSVFAEELGAKPVNQENTEVLFGDLNDNDKVVELEDGGFLYGEATVIEKNQTQYVSRGGSGMIYYTYSPLQGTYYYVVNI